MDQQNIYSIGKVAELTGFKSHVIRFYEKEFNLIIPREKNNRRYFTNKEVNQLLYIKELKNKGIANKEIRSLINSEGNIESEISLTIDGLEEVSIEKPVKSDKKTNTDVKNNDNFISFKKEILTVLEKYNYKNEISVLKDKIEKLSDELGIENNKEKDVLLCENAKLKLKIKEKTYEIAELKDKLKRNEHKRASIFRKILRIKNAN